MAQSGTILAERYRLIEPLGQGGMGTVWRAEHVELGSQVAVKLIDEGILELTETVARFKREAKAAAALNSIHVVQIFDYGVDGGIPYIAMELLKGESLGSRIDRVRQLSPEEFSKILTQVARGLDKAHGAGIVHRDIKPDNIFLTRNDDEEEIAKILDFGVAKTVSPEIAQAATSHTRTGTMIGSPSYMSPEQLRGAKTLDHHTDLWALGIIGYEALVGARPFDGESLGDLVIAVCMEEAPVPSQHGPVPEGFDAWFLRACDRDPSRRFHSAKEMADEFQALLQRGVTVVPAERASASALPEPAAQPARTAVGQTDAGLVRSGDSSQPVRAGSSKALVVGGGIAVVVAAAAIGVFVMQSRRTDSPAIAESATIVTTVTAPATTPPEVVDAAVPQDAAAVRVEPEEPDGSGAATGTTPTRNPKTTIGKPPPVETTKPTGDGTRPPPTAPPATGTGRDYGF